MVDYAIYPRYQFITDISNARNAVVSFGEDHDFTDGELVSFRVAPAYGMVEANNQHVRVLSHTEQAITVQMDSTFFTPFVTPAADTKTSPAVCVPSASGIVPGGYVATMNLEDSFDNRRTN